MNDSQVESTNNQKLNTSAPPFFSSHMAKGCAVGYHTGSHSAVANVAASNTFVRDLHRDDESFNAALQHLNKATPDRFKSGSTPVEIIQSATTFIQTRNGTIQALRGTIQTLNGTIQALSGSTQTHPVIDTKNNQSSNADPFPKHSAASTSLVTSLHSDSTESSSKDIEKFATDKISPGTGDRDTRNNDIMEITRIADQKRPESERMHCPDQQTPTQTTSFEPFINALSTDNTSGRDTESRALTCSPEDYPKAMYGHEPNQAKQHKLNYSTSRKLKKHCYEEIRGLLHLEGMPVDNLLIAATQHIIFCQKHHQKMQLDNTPTSTDQIEKQMNEVVTRVTSKKPKQGPIRKYHEPRSDKEKKRNHADTERRRNSRVHTLEYLLIETLTQYQMLDTPRIMAVLAAQNPDVIATQEATALIGNCIKQHTPEQGYTAFSRPHQVNRLSQPQTSLSSDPHSPTGLSNTLFSEIPDRSSTLPNNDSLTPKPHNSAPPFFSEDLPIINNSPNLPGSYDKSKRTVRPFNSLLRHLPLSHQTAGSSSQIFPSRDATSQGIQHAPNLESRAQKGPQFLPQAAKSSSQTFPPRGATSQGIQHAPDTNLTSISDLVIWL